MSLKRRSSWNLQDSVWVWAGPLAAVLVLMLIVSPLVRARPGVAAASAIAPGAPKLAFLVTTGLEDAHALDTVLHCAIAARTSGHFSEVVVLADGRGVEMLAAHTGGRTVQTAQLAKQAKASGIRFVVAGTGLKQADVTKTELDPAPDEIIADGGAKLAALISQHYEIIHL